MMKTVREILKQGEWLTAEQLNAFQVNPPSQKSLPASDWARRGGRMYFARYQFDEAYQPLPVIEEVLRAFGEVADNFKIAAWFHYPNGWLSKPGTQGRAPLAPKGALDQRAALLRAAIARRGSYEA